MKKASGNTIFHLSRGRFPPWKSFKNNRPPHITEYFHSNLNHLYSNISVNSVEILENKFLGIQDPLAATPTPGGGGGVPPVGPGNPGPEICGEFY